MPTSFTDFAQANPVIALLFIVVLLVGPGGVVVLWMQRKRDVERYERDLENGRTELAKLQEQGEQEARREQSRMALELLDAQRTFTSELAANRKEREANGVLLSGFLENQKRLSASLEEQQTLLTRIETSIAAEFDVLDSAQTRMFDAIRAAQEQHSASFEQTRSGIGELSAEIEKRFDRIDPHLLQLNNRASQLERLIADLPKAIAATKTDLLAEMHEVSKRHVTLGEQLRNTGDKLDRLDTIATVIQSAATGISADIKQLIKSGTGPLPPIDEIIEPAAGDEDTKQLPITKAGMETPSIAATVVGLDPPPDAPRKPAPPNESTFSKPPPPDRKKSEGL